MRFSLPRTTAVRTESTSTFHSFSTAWRISTLLASFATSNRSCDFAVSASAAGLPPVSLRRVPFSVRRGRLMIISGERMSLFLLPGFVLALGGRRGRRARRRGGDDALLDVLE